MLVASLALLTLTTAASPSLSDLRARYLDGLFRARPHLASFMGDHHHEGELMDLSAAAVKRRVAELEKLSKQVAALDGAKLSPDDRADEEILADGVNLELLYLRDLREWTWDPRLQDSFPFYDPREVVAARLSDLIHHEFAPRAQRLAWLRQQLAALPRLLDQKMRAVAAPSLVHLEQAAKDNRGRIEFFDTDVRAFTAGDAAAEKARLKAVAALRRYQQFLEQFPREKATHDWRLGKALYEKKFPLALQTRATPDELKRRAGEAFVQARARLYQRALKIAAKLWPREPPPPPLAAAPEQAQLIRRVQDVLSQDHPRPEELVQAHAQKLASLRAFITEKKLLALPPADTLRVEPYPEFKRGVGGAEYLSPGMLDKTSTWVGTFYVDPVDPAWPPEKVQSYLRANNTYEIALTAAHEAYPGHHTQAWYARKDESPLRATLWSGAFAEGWAVYGEQLIAAQGYGGEENDRILFQQAKGMMIASANAVLDVKLQSGEMTDEEALRFMEDEGFQEVALAERKLQRAKLDSTQLCQYFLGFSEIMDLEKAVRTQGLFDQRAFDEALLSHGTVPVKVLRELLLPRS